MNLLENVKDPLKCLDAKESNVDGFGSRRTLKRDSCDHTQGAYKVLELSIQKVPVQLRYIHTITI